MIQHMDDLRLIKESGGFRKDVKQFSASYQEPSTSREVLERQGTLLSLEGNSTEYGHGFPFSKPFRVHQKITKMRRRPYIKKRQEQKRESKSILQELYGAKEKEERLGTKRKTKEQVLKEKKLKDVKSQGWSRMRDCRNPNEYNLLELSGSGTASGTDNSAPKGNASKTFSGITFSYGNNEL